jgi:RNA polymerase sigma-70 factor (ECF subfamily)
MALEKFTDNIADGFKKRNEERRLEKGVKSKDKEAFLQAYDGYVNDIYRFIYFKIGNSEEANDITSQVFLKTWNYVQENKLKNRATLKALIYKIARNTIIDHYRSNSKAEKVNIDNNIDDDQGRASIDIEDKSQDIARQAEINSDMEEVRRNLGKLKDEYKEVLILKYVNELSFKEIAAITGKSKSNTRVLAHRALKALRELMQ